MSIENVLRRAGLTPWVDARAGHRQQDAPKKIQTSEIPADDLGDAINLAARMSPVPLVLIMRSGGVLVMCQGGYGPVAVQGSLDSMTEEQAATLSTVMDALGSAYGIEVESGPKRKSKKKAPVVEVVLESEDGVEEIISEVQEDQE